MAKPRLVSNTTEEPRRAFVPMQNPATIMCNWGAERITAQDRLHRRCYRRDRQTAHVAIGECDEGFRLPAVPQADERDQTDVI